MYNCQDPNHKGERLIPPGTKSIRKPVEWREVTYRNDQGKTSVGLEIEREIIVCPTCAERPATTDPWRGEFNEPAEAFGGKEDTPDE